MEKSSNQICTKSQFAGLVRLSCGRVTQLIAEGKLTAPALVRINNRTMINIPAARQQLIAQLIADLQSGVAKIARRIDVIKGGATIEQLEQTNSEIDF